MKKILVIEDEQALRQNVLKILTLEGFEVLEAEDGSVGVQLAKMHLPDLILCDIRMPRLDGYGVLAELRRVPECATIPFVFMTAKANKLDIQRGLELGVNDYLTKPFEITEFLRIVRSQFAS